MTNVANPNVVITASDKTQAAFRSVRQSMRSLEGAASGINRALGTIGVGLSAGLVVGTLTRAAAAAIEFGDEVQKASQRTGIGAAAFAELASAAKLADVDMGTLSKGLRALQVAVSQAASGAKAPLETFRALGIEIDQLVSLDADQQLERVADQLAALRSPADRARAGVDLFGKAWQDLGPFLAEGSAGIRAARKEIEALGGALTDQEIQQLADADAAVKQLSASWEAFARTLTAKARPAIVGVLDTLRKGLGGGTEIEDLRDELDRLNETIDRMPAEVQSKPINQNILQRRRIVESRLAQLGQYESRGPQFRGNAPAPVTAPGFAPTATTRDAGATSAAAKRTADDLWVLRDPVIGSIRAWEELKQNADAAMADIGRQVGDWAEQGLEDLTMPVQQAMSEWQVFADEAARGMQTAFADFLFDPFSEGLDGMLAGFVDVIRRMIAELAAQELLRAFFTWGSGLGGGIGTFFGSLAGARAGGGPMAAGSAYLVGEKGPEIVVPNTNSYVIPNGMGSSVNVSYHIDARGADADRIMAILPPLLKQTEDRTIARVVSLNRKGRLA